MSKFADRKTTNNFKTICMNKLLLSLAAVATCAMGYAGTGTQDDPYTVAEIIAMNPSSTTDAVATDVWVEGYIVGSIPTTGTVSIRYTEFGVANAAQTNLVMAALANCTDYNDCIAVQLSAGAIRSALNLSDNPNNYGADVLICGSVMKYCGAPGLKSLSDYEIVEPGEAPGVDPGDEPTTEVPVFKYTTEIADGKYLLYYDGTVATPLAESKTYGYLYTTSVELEGDEITISADNAFTITAVTGGYTIQDPNGRYYYQSGTYNSFNVDADMPAEGAVWSITFDPNGHAIITNLAMNKFIQYDTNYSSFGSYEDARGELPTLFVMTDKTETPDTPETPTEETAQFNLASSMEEGDYVIITDGHMALPLAETYNYGYPQTESVDVANNAVTVELTKAFTFTAVSGGYTIQDTYGRYYYLSGTYNSSNVSAELPAEGAVWTVTINADGAAAIVNVDKQKTMQYDETYNSYGFYADVTHTLPSLYLKATTGIGSIEAEAVDGPVRYFDLQGREVLNPEAGRLYIRLQGSKAQKVIK